MSSLRSRRASSSTAPSSKDAPRDTQQLLATQEDSDNKERNLALTSITSCYRNAFYSTAVDVFLEFSLPAKDSLDAATVILKLLQSLHILGFGIGLYQCKQVYLTTLDNKSLSVENLHFIFGVMKRVWMTSAIVLTLGSAATSTDFGDYLQNNEKWYHLSPLLVFVVSISVGILVWSSKNTPLQDSSMNVDKQMEAAKQDGLVVLRNMLLCIGALYINAATLLVDDIMNPTTSAFEKFHGLTDVAEPIAIAILLQTLRTHVGQFLMMTTTSANTHNISIHNDKNSINLYKAQQGFYTKISSVFFSAATTKLVSPWLAVLKGYVWSSRDWCNDYPTSNKIVQKLAGCE